MCYYEGMKKTALYRLEIAPLVILPLGRSPLFSYLSDKEIPLGSLVRIPFGRREIEGVVFESASFPGRPPHWMKYVASVLRPGFLTKEQCMLARAISEEYLAPLGKTLKHFLPKPTVARKKRVSDAKEKRPALKARKDESVVTDIFMKSPVDTPLYLDTTGLEDAKHCLSLLSKKITSKHQQVLVLVPEITLVPAFEAAYRVYFASDAIAVLHSQLADGPYFEAWERIRSGVVSVIIATRQGLFAPFHDLGLVIVAEEQDESYKQWDMSPRYDGRRVAALLADLHGAKHLFVSETPSIESRYRIAVNDYLPLRPLSLLPAFGNKLEVVNLRLERFRKNYSPLSETLVVRIRETLSAGHQALLYIHRQGMSMFSVCEDCKAIFRCPECGKALTSTKDGRFRCLSCSFTSGLFPKCPKCGHLSFRNVGFGTERVEKEVRKMFPGASVFRADSQTMRRPGAAQKLYEEASSGRVDILIGTQMILKDFSLPKLALIAMIDADSLLSFPDFRSDERLFQHLERAVKRVGPEHVIIQTFHPESAFLQNASAYDSWELAKRLTADREALLYPPFARLAAISFRDKTVDAAMTSAQAAADALRKLLIAKQSGAKVSAIRQALPLPRKQIFESSFLLRVPISEDMPYQELHTLLKKRKDCIIDIDPITFH
jgi:primosomal protein N' (replication factor Y)